MSYLELQLLSAQAVRYLNNNFSCIPYSGSLTSGAWGETPAATPTSAVQMTTRTQSATKYVLSTAAHHVEAFILPCSSSKEAELRAARELVDQLEADAAAAESVAEEARACAEAEAAERLSRAEKQARF